jgi:hypothetical protein
MIFLITVREMEPLVKILLQKAPMGLSVNEIVKRIWGVEEGEEEREGERGEGLVRANVWMIDEQKLVGTMVFAQMEAAKKEEMMEWILENVGEVEWTVEVGVKQNG